MTMAQATAALQQIDSEHREAAGDTISFSTPAEYQAYMRTWRQLNRQQ